MENPRVLVGVCSHSGNRKQRDAVRETWLQRCPDWVHVVFFSGERDADEGDVVPLRCADDYMSLPTKVQTFFEYAVQNESFDYLFKCDDDTYLVPERLSQLLTLEAEIVGDMNIEKRWWFSGGAGYLMTRETVSLFAKAAIPPTGAEDVIFAKVARANERKMHADSRLRADARVYPMSNNELITVHRLDPEGMREAHQTYLGSLP